MSAELGQQLKTVRQLKGLSLRSVAVPAEISVAYLQKLEGGEVQQPSPNVLLRLGKVLGVPYETLMEVSGYSMPTPPGAPQPLGVLATTDSFAQALNSTDLSEEERRAVAAFVAHLRDQRSKKP